MLGRRLRRKTTWSQKGLCFLLNSVVKCDVCPATDQYLKTQSDDGEEQEIAMAGSLPRDEDYELWVLLHQTTDAISKARGKELTKYRISQMQAAVLFIVDVLGNKATVSEIARWLLREPHSVSGLVTRMEREGLVRKVSDLHRKNLVRVAITEKGRQAYYQSTKRESIHRIISSVTKQKRQRLALCLRTLRDTALEEFGIDYRPPFP